MPEPIVGQPIWTPEDARQTARDAEQHTAYPGTPADTGMRPRRARLIGRALVVLASAIILVTTFAMWAAGAR